jgi:hypothetical protein
MEIKTVTSGGKPKPFSFSYSKIKNFESCPKRHWHVDIAKDFKEEESDQLQYGNALHKALAEAIEGKKPLPKHFQNMQEWVDRVTSGGYTQILVEQQLAITKDFGPTEWFGKDAWYRAIADVIKINGPVALALDWKTGKIKEDGTQLALMASCIFSHHPEVQKIRTEFVWLKEDGATTRADFSRNDMPKIWNGVLPRVQQYEEAVRTTTFPPKPGFLCRKWCPVTSCPHHGE